MVGAALWILYDRGWQKPALLAEGVYKTCEEVSGFSGEILELKEGRFRYWFYTDVITGREPAYPLSGTYRIKGNTLVLKHPDVPDNERLIDILNGVHILWRDDGLAYWRKERQIQPYAVLIHIPEARANDVSARPSVDLLYTNEMRERRARRSEQLFADQPARLRAIFRALRTRSSDPGLNEYFREIIRVRTEPNPEVLGQLVGLLGDSSGLNIEAEDILSNILLPLPPLPGVPDDKLPKDDLHRLLMKLIDAFSSARDSRALQYAIMIYLEASEVHKIDLTIGEAGVRITLEFSDGPEGAKNYRFACEELVGSPNRPRDETWSEKMNIVIPMCQKWAREHLTD
jgi:hypothetical protein